MRTNIRIVLLVWITLAACGQPRAPETAVTDRATEASAASIGTGADIPGNVGDCAEAAVANIGYRLEGVPDSGSAITYTNRLGQVSYEAIPGIDHSQPGDAIRLCLIRLPQDCPPSDERGKVYSATNQRTHELWSAPDAQHTCGGA